MFGLYDDISVVCESIWSFFTVLPPRNLIRKPFIIGGVKKLSFCGHVGVGLYIFDISYYNLKSISRSYINLLK